MFFTFRYSTPKRKALLDSRRVLRPLAHFSTTTLQALLLKNRARAHTHTLSLSAAFLEMVEMANRLVLVVVCFCFLFEGSIGLTFSSKLIHRFSDEAKALWISRNGGNMSSDLWPKKHSFEYFQLLLVNDLKRQRMKLGSQNQLLIPEHGSQTFFFGNELDWLHYTWIDIGTPNVSFLVALDAGSDLLWVPCECIQCAPLSASYYSSLDRDLSEYRPSLSSTSKHLPCSHQLCELGSNCKNLKEPCPYIANYADTGNTSSSGYLIEDKLHLASVSENETRRRVQASVIIGCGRKQSGGYLDGAAPDGVMGLGPGSISVPSFLAKAGLIQKSFSLCFNENDSGRILFGDQVHASQKSTPLLSIEGNYVTYFVEVESYCVGHSCLKQSGFKALVDTGTSFTFLPRKVYNKIVLEFDKQVNAERISSQGGPWDYCYNTSSRELVNIPAMQIQFPMNQSFLVHKPTYSVPQNQEFTIFCLTLQQTDEDYGIIGHDFLTGYRVVFDMENLKFGWSSSNCQDISDNTEVRVAPPPDDKSPNPLPTNEQQSVPNKNAVAPALAGRTSSKPSSASHKTTSLLHLASTLLLLLHMCCLVVLPVECNMFYLFM